MSEESDEEIKAQLAEILRLEEQRKQLRKPLEDMQVFTTALDVDTYEKFRPRIMQVQQVEEELNVARQRLMALELGSINSAIVAVKDSTAKQVEVTSALRRSSRTLEALTSALLVLTAVLSVVGSGTYFLQAENEVGLGGQTALAWASFGTLIVVALVLVSFYIIKRRYPELRRPNH